MLSGMSPVRQDADECGELDDPLGGKERWTWRGYLDWSAWP
jgi:hypothetical protein